MPTPTDPTTSKKMSSVPQKGTSIELLVREVLSDLGIDYESNIESLPGRPDIWLIDEEIPIFVHGCFWHRHEGCKRSSSPKTNRKFWQEKFEKNMARDRKNDIELRDMGYVPMIVWQCETKDSDSLRRLIQKRLGSYVT